MKKQLQMCPDCKKETWHMTGKKQATNRSSAYIRRSTSECIKCGRKEISNKNKGKRVIAGKNETAVINNASLEVKDGN